MLVLFSIATINIVLFIAFQAHYDTDFAELRFNDILNTLECEGKNQLTMSIECSPTANNSFVRNTWATTGFVLKSHEITMGTAVVFGIIVLCGMLLFVTYNIDGTEIHNPNDEFAHITSNDLANITKLAEDMSKFFGEALAAYLIYHAIYTPSELVFIFSKSPFSLLSILLNHGTLYAGLLLGSVASLRVCNRKNLKEH